MRVFDELKSFELQEYDLEKGYLRDDKLFIEHHEEVPEESEISAQEVADKLIKSGYEVKKIDGAYYKVIKSTADGAQVERIKNIPPKPKIEAYDEYEDIKVYVLYTEQELQKIKEKKYSALVEKYIREKYTLSDELAILRQRDSKPNEFAEYNAYAESCKAKAKAEIQ